MLLGKKIAGICVALLAIAILAACGSGPTGPVPTTIPPAPVLSTVDIPSSIPSSVPSPIVRSEFPTWDPLNVEDFGQETVAILLQSIVTGRATLDPQDDVRLITAEDVWQCSSLSGGDEGRRLVGGDYSEPPAIWCASAKQFYLHELALRKIEKTVPGSAQVAILVATGDYILEANGKPDASPPCGAGVLARELLRNQLIIGVEVDHWSSLLPVIDQPIYTQGLVGGINAC